MFNFKKKTTVGVAVTPQFGLEVIQIDTETRTILKYGKKPLDYNNNQKDIADIDIFKETLSDLLIELEIPKGAGISLSLPSVLFGIKDCPAAWSYIEIEQAIVDELSDNPRYEDMDFCISSKILPNSTIQMNKVVYEGLSRTTLIEVALAIQEMGYTIDTIDTSINTTLKSLVYNNLIQADPTKTWSMLQVDNNFARLIVMQGISYVDCYEEAISIGEVLGDEENYNSVLEVTAPLIKNISSEILYIISKTNVIKAETLASRITSKATVLHLEDNMYCEAPLLDIAPDVTITAGENITMDVIGAGVIEAIEGFIPSKLNLYNKQLGEVFTSIQPLSITIGGKEIVLSMENMIKVSVIFGFLLGLLFAGAIIYLIIANNKLKNDIESIKDENEQIQLLISKYNISTEEFDEGDEIRIGLTHNKKIYTYMQIIGSEIPQKLWLTSVNLSDYVTIKGQANNLESIYGFFRNVRDYSPEDKIKLKKLELAAKSDIIDIDGGSDKNSSKSNNSIQNLLINSLSADFYQFNMTNDPNEGDKSKKSDDDKKDNKTSSKSKIPDSGLMEDISN